ncbi:hypothetical protein, partial [Enterococcus faecalis]|uniref:hypothetical protein n=1 Tax=Enterococcus faecalis TaxID=1351 RepID=UPI00403EF783
KPQGLVRGFSPPFFVCFAFLFCLIGVVWALGGRGVLAWKVWGGEREGFANAPENKHLAEKVGEATDGETVSQNTQKK